MYNFWTGASSLTLMLLNSDDDPFLQTFNCHFIFFVIRGFYLYSSSWSCIWDMCIWKDYTRVKLSNILTMVLQEKAYSVSGCDLFSAQSWLWTWFCSSALMFVFLVWAVHAEVDIFREILKTFMQVTIALLMLFAYLMLNNAIVNKESVVTASFNKF